MARRVTENSLERTARLLASGHKIKVVFKPGVAETVNDVITLPTLPDNANQELVDAMQGYLDQQTGYVLFSDQAEVQNLKLNSKKGKKEAQLWDTFRMVEDARTEECVEDIYPGSELNFTNAHFWLYNRLRANWDKTDEDGNPKISEYAKILASVFIQRRHRQTEFFDSFVEDTVKEKAQKALDILKDVDPQTTGESLEVAKRLLEEFYEEAEEDLDQRPEPGDDGDEGDGTSENPMSMAEAISGQGNPGGEDESGQEIVEGQDDLSKALAQAAQREIQENAENAPNMPGRGDYTHGLNDGESYTIYTTEHDSIEHLAPRDLPTYGDYLQTLRDESRGLTSTMRQKLINSLRATSRRRWVSGKPEGRLDSRRAHKAILGISQDVYKVRTKKVHLDTAVALAIDHSGSMAGRPLELSAESAIVLGDVFDPLKIPFLVYGYSTRGYPFEYPPHGEQHHYARFSNLWIRHYKNFDESWRSGALKLTAARDNCQANTLDGESILYGIRNLLARPEKRKILLVFNDGAPFPGFGNVGRCQGYLKSIVEAGTNAGVEIIAFGIRTDEVKEYYPNHVVVNNLDDLVKEPLRKIDGMLRKGLLNNLR